MPKYEFTVTITVSVEVDAADVLAAQKLIEVDTDALLFESDPVRRLDTPEVVADLTAVDGGEPSPDDLRKLLRGEETDEERLHRHQSTAPEEC